MLSDAAGGSQVMLACCRGPRAGGSGRGLAVAAGLSAYQQYLMRDRELAACFRAFLNNNYLGLALFLGLFLDYALS